MESAIETRAYQYGNALPGRKSQRKAIVKRKKEPPTEEMEANAEKVEKKVPLSEEEKKEKYLKRTSSLSQVNTWIANMGNNADARIALLYLEKFNMFLILGGHRSGKLLMPIPACMFRRRVKIGEKSIETSRLKGPAKLVNKAMEQMGYKTLIVPRTINERNSDKLQLLVILP